MRLGVAVLHFISGSVAGEACRICCDPAVHKIGEEIAWDDPRRRRHNLTPYVCCGCFRMIFGRSASSCSGNQIIKS
jgi:hypothetical protein